MNFRDMKLTQIYMFYMIVKSETKILIIRFGFVRDSFKVVVQKSRSLIQLNKTTSYSPP